MKRKLLALAGLTTMVMLGSTVNAQINASGMSEQDFDRIYSAMDTNKDGRISRAEYAAYHGAQFDTWDSAKTGMMSREQIRTKQFEREMRKTDGNPQGNSPTSAQKK